MRVKQLTTLDQGRMDAWFSAAINSPRVRPYFQHLTHNDAPAIAPTDLNVAHFMDDKNNCYMRLTFERAKREMRLSMWSLEESQRTVAAMMRVAMVVAPKYYAMEYLVFSIHNSNAKWLAAWERRFKDYRWGIEPHAAWDIELKAWCPSHHFKIPITAIEKHLSKVQL